MEEFHKVRRLPPYVFEQVNRLKASQQAQLGKGGKVQGTSPAALNSLAKNHGDETLKQIEAKCDPALDPTCK